MSDDTRETLAILTERYKNLDKSFEKTTQRLHSRLDEMDSVKSELDEVRNTIKAVKYWAIGVASLYIADTVGIMPFLKALVGV